MVVEINQESTWKEELGIIVEAASINADSLYKGKKKIPQTNENNTKQQF